MNKQTMGRIFNKASVDTPQAEHWYQIRAAAEGEAAGLEIYIYGEIGGWGITAHQFVRDLKALDDGVSPVTAAFNSIGGDLFDGLAIHNALARLGERCTARIDALAASAASVAACGAHRVVIAANGMMMIHNPWTWASGDAEDLRKVADVLDQTLEAIIAAYKAKAPEIDEAELRRLVNAETWLTAQEAVDLGLADEVGAGVEVKACVGNGAAMRRYQHTPEALLNQGKSEPVAEPKPVESEQGSAALALLVTNSCSQAGFSELAADVIKASQLESEAAVQATLTRARAIRDLCVAARLPELTQGYFAAGLDAVAVRARLFDKLVSRKGGLEIDNSVPIQGDNDTTRSTIVDSDSIWAARKARHTSKQGPRS